MSIQIDPTLVSDVRQYGKFDVNACYQCGSCTVTCNLTNGSASFPRRTIRYVLMGLRKTVRSSLDPWLCYYCGDCSITCPRQTDPGEAMMTIRRFLTAQYDWTGLSAKFYKSKAWEIGSLFSVGLFVLALALYYHTQIVEIELPDLVSSEFIYDTVGDDFMGHMFGMIETFTIVVFLIPLVVLLSNALRMYWLTLHSENEIGIPFKLYFIEAKTLFLHALTQKRFKDCDEPYRWLIHGLLVLGCVLMFIPLLFFLEWFQTDNVYPLSHPQRWIGYIATAALIFASLEILVSRFRRREEMHKYSTTSDWILPTMLLLTAVSGIMVHIFRYYEFAIATHFMYAIHLAIVVPTMVIEIPFGKASHMLYRPLAMYFEAIRTSAIQMDAIEKGSLADAG